MSQLNIDFKETIPVGQLGIIPLQSSWELGKKVNEYIVSWRKERESAHSGNILFENYKQDTYIIDAKSVPEKPRVQLTNPSAEKTCI